jgi:hypothetical protein
VDNLTGGDSPVNAPVFSSTEDELILRHESSVEQGQGVSPMIRISVRYNCIIGGLEKELIDVQEWKRPSEDVSA